MILNRSLLLTVKSIGGCPQETLTYLLIPKCKSNNAGPGEMSVVNMVSLSEDLGSFLSTSMAHKHL